AIIYLATISSIDPTLYEAAIMDGANRWQRFYYLTLPLMRNTIFFVAVIALAATFQTYDQIAVLTKDGGPNHATNVLLFNIRIAFSNGDYDLANAQSILLVLMVLLLTLLAYGLAETRQTNLD
ncbi:MAG: sugar ABC transporter permease, partial [Thermostichus sp. BF3_bins_97]